MRGLPCPWAGKPGPRPARPYEDDLDARIGQSIKSGVDVMLRNFDNSGISEERGGDPSYHWGLDALAIYALLQCNDAIKDDRLSPQHDLMRHWLAELKSAPMDSHYGTYAHSLRNALAFLNRSEDQETLKADVHYLLSEANRGGYTYSAAEMKNFGRAPACSSTIPIRSTACSESGPRRSRHRGAQHLLGVGAESLGRDPIRHRAMGLPRPGRESTASR